jgi:hypothetical protein
MREARGVCGWELPVESVSCRLCYVELRFLGFWWIIATDYRFIENGRRGFHVLGFFCKGTLIPPVQRGCYREEYSQPSF